MDLCPLREKWIRRPLCYALDWKKKEVTPSVLKRCLYGRDSQWKMSTKPKSAVRTELLSIYAYDLCMFQVNSPSVWLMAVLSSLLLMPVTV